MAEKVKGTVKFFNTRKGFGFITPTSDNASTKEDVFVHQSAIVVEDGKRFRTLVSVASWSSFRESISHR